MTAATHAATGGVGDVPPPVRALVTGGTSGVGLALARQLVATGARVAICGRDAARLAAASATLGPRAHAVACDLSAAADCDALMDVAVRALGGVTLLINNAGVQQALDVRALDTETLAAQARRELAINLEAPLRLARLALPHLEAAARAGAPAAIVNVTSGLALTPKKTAPIYCASKAALRSLTIALRYQLEDAGSAVRVHEAILPIVDTPMTAGRGRSKLSADAAAAAILRGVARGVPEIRVGKVRIFMPLQRALPSVAARLLRDG
ncbi:MAG: SDR family NAD(P)-dependent oxidoreductase [Gemmatimonadaceae bacterium]|jgi:uncharacterized oxidoreductase|nr:SDR family NAD(P)-dependent oxidoreductase [Gemmatimonadaceae bacterium]